MLKPYSFLKYIIFIVLFLQLYSVNAQKRRYMINPEYDDKFLHLGFALGINVMDYAIAPSERMLFSDSVFAVSDKHTPGFNLGIVTDFRVNKHLNFMFIPSMDFGARSLQYKVRDFDVDTALAFIDPPHTMNYSTIYIDIPALFKFRAKRINNYRPYLLLGGSVKYDLDTRRAHEKNKDYAVRMEPLDYFLEVGGGVDFYLPYFRLSTEMKMCFGFNDILVPDHSDFTKTVSSIRSKVLIISFLFE